MECPEFIYGTAWKTEKTLSLCQKALKEGFRAIDTANQPKHYNEPAVGEALVEFLGSGGKREDLFIQTKFTPIGGHDHRVPYDASQPVAEQVRTSFALSLKNLRTDYVDSYLLHGPYGHPALVEEDWEVWTVIEEISGSGGARHVGISNVNALQLGELVSRAKVKPHFVQNRCFANRMWDADVRQICKKHGIRYQGFSLLTANQFLFSNPRLLEIAEDTQMHPIQVIFRFALEVGMIPLTGTSDSSHMKLDLEASGKKLGGDYVGEIERMGVE